MRKNVYLIIGEGRCGKSSLVRALTGVYRHRRMGVRLMPPENRDIDIAIWSQSCQESGDSPEDILQYLQDETAPYVLMTIRFHTIPGMAPFDAIEYYKLIEANHNIVGVAFMGPRPENEILQFDTIPQAAVVADCLINPINANASIVRHTWGWM